MPDSIKETFFILDEGVWRLPNVGERCCQRPALAKTLKRTIEEGVEHMYNTGWGDKLIRDINELPFPGIFEKKDLRRSRPVVKEPIKAKVFGMDVLTVPPPSSGATLIMALKFLDLYHDHPNENLSDHRMVDLHRPLELWLSVSGGGHEAYVCCPFAFRRSWPG